MKYFKIFQYAYLVLAGLFIFEAITKWNEDRTRAYTMLFFTALIVFIFFFRLRFYKKFNERNNNE